jgi:hypothetical protein
MKRNLDETKTHLKNAPIPRICIMKTKAQLPSTNDNRVTFKRKEGRGHWKWELGARVLMSSVGIVLVSSVLLGIGMR